MVNLGEVTLGAFEANDDIGMGCVFHTSTISPWGGDKIKP